MLGQNPGFEYVTEKFLNRTILLDLRFSARPRERQALVPLGADFFGWRLL